MVVGLFTWQEAAQVQLRAANRKANQRKCGVVYTITFDLLESTAHIEVYLQNAISLD